MSQVIEIADHKFKLIGDPHLGRVFKTGVPTHRLGGRENFVNIDFCNQVQTTDNTPIIVMGDLFDKYSVSENIVLDVAETLNSAAEWKKIYILRGNHDESRDEAKRGSFDVLERLCPNVVFVKTFHEIILPNHAGRLALFGYDAFKSAAELAAQLTEGLNYLAAFGHYDLTSHGSDFNLVPTEVFAELKIPVAYTGHIHRAQTIERHGVTVHAVGSMQPYAHGEQAEGDPLYQTLTLDEFNSRNPEDFLDVNLRILLKGDEVFDTQLDCLSLVFKHIAEDEAEPLGVAYDSFDSDNILTECLVGVSEGLTSWVKSRLTELKMENT
jgi:DNA repair exonuclease SbcCD nuclease subunit